MTIHRPKFRKGFTLIEILLAISIIAALAAIIIVTLDPVKRFQDARDTQRRADIESIMNAIQRYALDNKGSIPSPGFSTSDQQIGIGWGCELYSGSCAIGEAHCLEIGDSLSKYLKSIPYDTKNGSPEATRYSISMDNETTIITVKACDAERSEISLSQSL